MTVEGAAVTACPDVIHMPHRRAIARQAGHTVLVASILPMAVFYGVQPGAGMRPAILATLGWCYAGLLLRLARRKPVLAAALLGAVLLTVRTVVAFLTDSMFVYFLQPVAGTVAMATALAATAMAGRPILDRLTHEFCPLPDELSRRLRQCRFFARLSVVWSVNYFVNAAGTVWLLISSSVGGFIMVKSVLSPLLTGTAVLVSYLLFRRALRRAGVRVRWGQPALAVPAG